MNYKMKNVERHSDTNMCQNMLRKRYESDLKNKKKIKYQETYVT